MSMENLFFLNAAVNFIKYMFSATNKQRLSVNDFSEKA